MSNKFKLYEEIYGKENKIIDTDLDDDVIDGFELEKIKNMEIAMEIAMDEALAAGYDNISDLVKNMHTDYKDIPGGMTSDEQYVEHISKSISK